MSCNTKTSLAAVIDAVNAQLNNNYVDRDDPRIDQGVFTEPTIRGGLMLDEAAKLDFCGYVTECGQREPFGKQWVDRPLYPYNTLVSYEDEGEIKSRWQDIDDVVAGTEIGESYTTYEETRSLGLQGYTIIDSFELGATITQRDDALRHAEDGKLYRWAGDLPKVVPADSTPETSGGIAANAWLEVSDIALRQELLTVGAKLVKGAVIYVTSIAEMESYSVPVGTVFSLNAAGRSGEFEVVGGDFEAELAADNYNGIYVGLADNPTANTKVAKRRFNEAVDIGWFGAVGDYNGTTGTDNTPYIQAALKVGKRLTFGNSGRFKMSGVVGIDNGKTLYSSDLYIIESHGATLVLDSPEPVFTSQRALATPDSGKDFYTSKVMFQNLIVEQHSPSVMIAGDYIYNSTLRGCSIKGVTTVIKSWKAKSKYPDGYMQSFYVLDNEFTLVNKIIDAKRCFNVIVDNNRFEACTGGVYIDGVYDQRSIYNLRITNNLFEGGGLFAKLGITFASNISNNYLEQNYIGDAAADALNCAIYAKQGAGQTFGHAGLVIENNMVSGSAVQSTDVNYADFKLSLGANRAVSDPILRANTTTGYRLCDIPLTSAEGTTFGQDNRRFSRVGLSANESKVNYDTVPKVFLASSELNGDVFTIATISVFRIRQMLTNNTISPNEIPAVFDMSVLVRPRSANGEVFSNAHVKISGVLGFASEGQDSGIVNDVYVGLTLESVTEIPAGLGFKLAIEGQVALPTRSWWDSPALNVVRSGSLYKVQLSGFSNLEVGELGDAFDIQTYCTLSYKSANDSEARATFLDINPA